MLAQADMLKLNKTEQVNIMLFKLVCLLPSKINLSHFLKNNLNTMMVFCHFNDSMVSMSKTY